MRMQDKVAIIVGAGQSPGEGMGNGRAVSVLFAREGAKVLSVDRDGASAAETADIIKAAGGDADSAVADVADEQGVIRIHEQLCPRVEGEAEGGVDSETEEQRARERALRAARRGRGPVGECVAETDSHSSSAEPGGHQ